LRLGPAVSVETLLIGVCDPVGVVILSDLAPAVFDRFFDAAFIALLP
jgi:hypothetical protein